ncbi:PLDc N-terminal domain-containing protein [Desulfovibrio sp. OttesenSCG-928-F07]|nr:PLDc N-terminal domain-containing protein [Desulfovibrio sp. OttesenSCG-928-F07]
MTELLNAMPDWPLVAKLAILALPMLLNLWGITHAFAHRVFNPVLNTIWMCICVFLPVIGGVLYLAIGFKQIKKQKENPQNNAG